MKIMNIDGKEQGNIDLPQQFKEEVRADLIKRAVEVIHSNNRQPYGAKPRAGKRNSVNISKQRHDYKTCYGHGISRSPRKIMSRNGNQMNWVGAFAPNTVGGRRAHPPKSNKIVSKSINDKERKKAIRSALAACIDKDVVKCRGHIVPNNYPFIVSDNFGSLAKTKEVKNVLETLGLKDELIRVECSKVRAGRGKLRGRKHKSKKGPLIVVGKECKLMKSARNIPGIEIALIKNINCSLLAPGTAIGRLTLFTEDSIKELKDKKLFI